MANLKLSYKNVYDKVGEFMGQPSPSAAEIVKHKSIVLRGYRRFLAPLDLSTQPPKVHKWKFLEKTTTLSTQADEDTYKLPLGFSSFITTFVYTTPISFNPVQKPLSFIYEYKSKHRGTGYPQYFALKAGAYDNITGQNYEVIFAPTPSATLNYYYVYTFTPPQPVNDDDVFVGNELASECILECALAVAEVEKNDIIGVHNQMAEKLTQQLIGTDKQTGLVPNLGQMRNGRRDIYVRSAILYDQNGLQILPEL